MIGALFVHTVLLPISFLVLWFVFFSVLSDQCIWNVWLMFVADEYKVSVTIGEPLLEEITVQVFVQD